MADAFEANGFEVFTVELDTIHPRIDLYEDILNVTSEMILEKFGRPDVIWASPVCTTYSIAAISHHRTREVDGNLAPKSEYAFYSDRMVQHTLKLIEELKPKYYFIENPRGGLRKMNFMKELPRHTVWYCTYGDNRAKPTDIWTNHPNPQFKPICHNGNKNCHHEAAPRGARTGTQGRKGSVDRSKIPQLLCEHIANICQVDLIHI
jgi:hypothetical protein